MCFFFCLPFFPGSLALSFSQSLFWSNSCYFTRIAKRKLNFLCDSNPTRAILPRQNTKKKAEHQHQRSSSWRSWYEIMTKLHARLCSYFYWNKLLVLYIAFLSLFTARTLSHPVNHLVSYACFSLVLVNHRRICPACAHALTTHCHFIRKLLSVQPNLHSQTRSHSSSTSNEILIFNLIQIIPVQYVCVQLCLLNSVTMNNVPGSHVYMCVYAYIICCREWEREREIKCMGMTIGGHDGACE